MITKKEFENFMKEYGFKSIDDLKEEEIIKEIKELKQQIAEKDARIDDLKQEREFMLDEVKNRGTCGLCEKLENKEISKLRNKLKEKDKEIEELHKYLELDWAMTPQRVDGKTWTKIEIIREWEKEIRHQVCEEFKERIEDLIEASFDNEEDEFSTITIWGLKKVLDQIEKGE